MRIRELHERLGYQILGIKSAEYFSSNWIDPKDKSSEDGKYGMRIKINDNSIEDDGIKGVERINGLVKKIARNLWLNPSTEEMKNGEEIVGMYIGFESKIPLLKTDNAVEKKSRSILVTKF